MQTVGQLFRAMLNPLTMTLKQHFIILVVSLMPLELANLAMLLRLVSVWQIFL